MGDADFPNRGRDTSISLAGLSVYFFLILAIPSVFEGHWIRVGMIFMISAFSLGIATWWNERSAQHGVAWLLHVAVIIGVGGSLIFLTILGKR